MVRSVQRHLALARWFTIGVLVTSLAVLAVIAAIVIVPSQSWLLSAFQVVFIAWLVTVLADAVVASSHPQPNLDAYGDLA